MRGLLKLEGRLGVRLEEAREHLAHLEHADKSICAFEQIIARAE